jgi:hypothetical protein
MGLDHLGRGCRSLVAGDGASWAARTCSLGREKLTMKACQITPLIISEFDDQNLQGGLEGSRQVLHEGWKHQDSWLQDLRFTCPVLLLADDGSFATIWMVVAFLAGILIYFLPSLIGDRKRNKWTIFVLNLLAGWTIVGWIIATVWACTSEPPTPTSPARVSPKAGYCGHCGQPVTGRFCANCGNPTGR